MVGLHWFEWFSLWMPSSSRKQNAHRPVGTCGDSLTGPGHLSWSAFQAPCRRLQSPSCTTPISEPWFSGPSRGIIVAIENPSDIIVASQRPYGSRAVLKFSHLAGTRGDRWVGEPRYGNSMKFKRMSQR